MFRDPTRLRLIVSRLFTDVTRNYRSNGVAAVCTYVRDADRTLAESHIRLLIACGCKYVHGLLIKSHIRRGIVSVNLVRRVKLVSVIVPGHVVVWDHPRPHVGWEVT